MQMKIITKKGVGVTDMESGLEDEHSAAIYTQVTATTSITGKISTVTDPDKTPTAALAEAKAPSVGQLGYRQLWSKI